MSDERAPGRVHTIGLTFGRPFTWATYCVECSEAAQEWVPVCPSWRDVPPRVLVARDEHADADDYLPNGTGYPGPPPTASGAGCDDYWDGSAP